MEIHYKMSSVFHHNHSHNHSHHHPHHQHSNVIIHHSQLGHPLELLDLPDDILFYAFYKSLMIPQAILSVILSSYSFKQMFKFRNLLYRYYQPLLSDALEILQKTASLNQRGSSQGNDNGIENNGEGAFWTTVQVTKQPSLATSTIEKSIVPNQRVSVLHNHTLVHRNLTTYCIRVTRTIPTRILKKMMSLILDYEKIPLWDVALRHCTGMVIKSPEINGVDGHVKKVDILHKQIIGNLFMTYVRMVYTESSDNDRFFASPNSNIHNDSNDSTTFKSNSNNNNSIISFNHSHNHNQPSMMSSSSTTNPIIHDQFNNILLQYSSPYPIQPTHNNNNINNNNNNNSNNNNNEPTTTTSDLLNNIGLLQYQLNEQHQDIIRKYQSGSPISSDTSQHQDNNDGRGGEDDSDDFSSSTDDSDSFVSDSEDDESDQDDSSESLSDSEGSLDIEDSINSHLHHPNSVYNSNAYSSKNHSRYRREQESDEQQDQDQNEDNDDEEEDLQSSTRAPLKRVRRNSIDEPILLSPIHIVQHHIPFHIKGMNNHLIDKEVQPFNLDCYGSGFIFEPIGDGKEIKMTYILQVHQEDWMDDEAKEMVDDLAISRGRSISSLISHAYHLSRST
ncbi:cyclin-like F-box containing protein [Cavenderia fasciculata]|uniref:Cyclin-like F-box containing protein n=1 Tax=Cavenderia fasciculata TaxID=261658 RepID=F4PZQ0_CACFS|nr:cyclin-like F-box containing protein [Cavenderia fasciculata]EGG18814.1 cyclin-like F-box containing protein [Cavenderia fasciculata]|eukprot:XP_004357276.1 cyclin-like F-box containing protein [Cavenderia fasciculata]